MDDRFEFRPVEFDPFQGVQDNPESWVEYAKNPEHPMVGRVGSGMVELARQKALGLKNALETFMGPMYGQGHVPMAGENGTEYAGAGFNLANLLGGRAPEGALSTGWNPRALEYLKGLLKQRPTLKPETTSAVRDMLEKGPEHVDTLENNAPGKGFGTLARTLHDVEEKQKSDTEKGLVGSTPHSLEEVMGLSGPSVVNFPASQHMENELMPSSLDWTQPSQAQPPRPVPSLDETSARGPFRNVGVTIGPVTPGTRSMFRGPIDWPVNSNLPADIPNWHNILTPEGQDALTKHFQSKLDSLSENKLTQVPRFKMPTEEELAEAEKIAGQEEARRNPSATPDKQFPNEAARLRDVLQGHLGVVDALQKSLARSTDPSLSEALRGHLASVSQDVEDVRARLKEATTPKLERGKGEGGENGEK